MRVDRAVSREVLDRVQPLGIEAALAAMTNIEQEQSEKWRQLANALEQARYEAARAYRQYDDVADPENRLVTADLERRWNERLVALRGARGRVRAARDPAESATRSLPIVNVCWLSAVIYPAHGIVPASPLRRARKSFAC